LPNKRRVKRPYGYGAGLKCLDSACIKREKSSVSFEISG
jgi:hypothetical protein